MVKRLNVLKKKKDKHVKLIVHCIIFQNIELLQHVIGLDFDKLYVLVVSQAKWALLMAEVQLSHRCYFKSRQENQQMLTKNGATAALDEMIFQSPCFFNLFYVKVETNEF